MVTNGENIGEQKRSRKRHHPQKRHIEIIDFPQLQQRSLNALFEYYEAHEAVCRLMKEENRQQIDIDKAIERLQKSIEERSKCDRLVDQYLLDNHIDFPQAIYGSDMHSNLGLNTNDAKNDKSSQIVTYSCDMIANNRSVTNAPQYAESDNNGLTSKNNEECIVENIRRWFIENKAVKDCEQRCMNIVEVVDAFLASAKKTTIQTTKSPMSMQINAEDEHRMHNVHNDDSMSCVIVDDDNREEMMDNEQNIVMQTDRIAIIEENKHRKELRMNIETINDESLTNETIVNRSETPMSILIIDDDGDVKNDEPTGYTTIDSNNDIDSLQMESNHRGEKTDECLTENLMEYTNEWEQQCLAIVPTHDAFLNEANKNVERSETPMSIIILEDDINNTQNNEAIRWDYETIQINKNNNEWEERYLNIAPIHHDALFLNNANEQTTTPRSGTPLPLITANEYVDTASYANCCDQPNECTFRNSDTTNDRNISNKKNIRENCIARESIAKEMFENIAECDECVTIEDLTPTLQTNTEYLQDIEKEVFDEWFMEIRKERECCHKMANKELQTNEKQTNETNLMEFIFINSKYKSMRRKLSRSHVICYKTMKKLQKMEENNEKLNQRIEELTAKLNRRDIEAMKQILEYDHLKATLNEANESLEKQRKQNAELFEKLNNSEYQLFILQDALNTMSTCNMELSAYLEQTRIEITATKAQCELLKEEKKTLEKQADALKVTTLNARQAYMQSASRFDVIIDSNKQIVDERDAFQKQRNTIYWNPYGEIFRPLQSNIATIQSPITTNPSGNAFNCVIIPDATDPSTIVGANNLIAMRHPLQQMSFTQYPQMQASNRTRGSPSTANRAAPAPPDGTRSLPTKTSMATTKTNIRRRRPRNGNGNTDGQTQQIATPHEDATRPQENSDQRGDSPINVVDMP